MAELTETQKLRAASFDTDAERYERARPAYPDDIFDALWRMTSLTEHPRVLEVGCGTGQSSLALVERGAELRCVEYGANMAAIARRKLAGFPSARIDVSRFEDWLLDEEPFDLVFASASWHWIETDIRYQKAASVLKSGGWLAVLRSEMFYPPDFDKLFLPIQDEYEKATGSRRRVQVEERLAEGELDKKCLDHVEELNRTGEFDRFLVTRHLWHIDRTADEYVDMLATYSDHHVMAPEAKERLFAGIHKVISESPTGSIRKHYLSTLELARRKRS